MVVCEYANSENISNFLRIVENDTRLSCTHMSLYFVLFEFWLRNKCQNPINITRKSVMKLAKLKSTATYHKCISELQEFGYVKYFPSFHPTFGSTITLLLNDS